MSASSSSSPGSTTSPTAENWRLLQEHGLLRTKALLDLFGVEAQEREGIVAGHAVRDHFVTIVHGHEKKMAPHPIGYETICAQERRGRDSNPRQSLTPATV